MEVVTIRGAEKILDRAACRQFKNECGINARLKFLSNQVVRIYTQSIEAAVRLYESRRVLFERKLLEWALDKIQIVWSSCQKPIEILKSPDIQTKDSKLMIQQDSEKFIWFGGVITPSLRSHLLSMEESDTPSGLLQPVISNGILKTVQWGINSASVKLFNYDAMSEADMKSAIQRDTSGDWLPEYLEEKRKLYQQAGDRFEQIAPIKIKGGWMRVRILSHRIGVENLVMVTGTQESEVMERPELLLA